MPTPYFRQAGRASKLEFMGLITFFCRPPNLIPWPVSLTANLLPFFPWAFPSGPDLTRRLCSS